MKTAILVSFFIMLILGACSSPVAPDIPKGITIHIEGTVTDLITKKSIDGALITLKDWGQVLFQVGTNHEGQYSIKGFYQPWREGNNFSIRAKKNGYWDKVYPEYAYDHRQPRYTEELQKIDFKLLPYPKN